MKKKSKLPEKKSKSFYDFYELTELVDKELGFDQRDAGKHFYPDTYSFDKWHNVKGYPETDSDGKHKRSSQIWFAEYQAEIASGKIKDTPYCDFWHWQMDACFGSEISNDSMNSLYVGDDEDEIYQVANDWQMKIQKVYKKLFYDISDDGWIDVEISW